MKYPFNVKGICNGLDYKFNLHERCKVPVAANSVLREKLLINYDHGGSNLKGLKESQSLGATVIYTLCI